MSPERRRRSTGPRPDARPQPWARPSALGIALIAAWAALLLFAPPLSNRAWAVNGFRSLGWPAQIGLLALAAAAGALAASRLRARWAWVALAVALAALLAFPLHERIHLLADTDLRMRSIGQYSVEPERLSLERVRWLHANPLDLAVDVLLPAWLTRAGLPKAAAVSWVWMGLGLVFLAGLARVVGRLGAAPEARTALVLAVALTGALEVFAGYPEVAGLTLVALVWWWDAMLAPLDSPGRAVRLALTWLAVLLVHRIGFALVPALLARSLGPALPGDRPGFRRLALGTSLAVAAAGIAVLAGTGGLPQLGEDAGRLFQGARLAKGLSRQPLGDFVNALLLVAPLALLAPVLAGREALAAALRDRRTLLFALAALPLLPVSWFEYSALNGLGGHREWDLGVTLGLTLTLAAAMLLARASVARVRGALAWCVPLLALQAFTWVAVNADEGASLARAEALATRAPLPLPEHRAQLFMYLAQRAMDASDPSRAGALYEQAFDLTPTVEIGVVTAETWMMAREPERARRMIARARAAGSPDSTAAWVLAGMDSMLTAYDRARAARR